MSGTPPSRSGTGNIHNPHQYPHHYPQLPAHHQQPFIQHYLQMPHIPQHYPPPLQHQYYPPHFIHTGQPLYQQYSSSATGKDATKISSSRVPSNAIGSNPRTVPGIIKSPSVIPGDNSKASHLNDAEAFGIAMDRLCHKGSNACTRVIALEVKNAAAKQTTTKAKKRTCEDDIPPAIDEDSTQLKAYKQLECHIWYRTSSYDNHHRLDHAEMTLWAKKIALGHATIYNQPHCLNFDHGPANKKPHHSRSGSSPEVHVTIQNITADPTIASTSKTPSPPPLLQQCHFESAAQIPNTTLPDYPKIEVLLVLIDAERLELRIRELETSLLDAGVVLSSQVMLLPGGCVECCWRYGAKASQNPPQFR
ncbi:hypothetical protein F4604DRAFT_1684669 [Suillus subluteus]|nr:hypothetical protein F4604DRAFT_1684669 [Suillus subluteus]